MNACCLTEQCYRNFNTWNLLQPAPSPAAHRSLPSLHVKGGGKLYREGGSTAVLGALAVQFSAALDRHNPPKDITREVE